MRAVLNTMRMSPVSTCRVVRMVLEALVPLAQYQCRSLPPLYRAGVRWSLEPDGVEEFADPVTVYARKWGDCWMLTLWRVAELRNAGEDARPMVTLVRERTDGSRLYHVRVRRADGRVEDPSKVLGMP